MNPFLVGWIIGRSRRNRVRQARRIRDLEDQLAERQQWPYPPPPPPPNRRNYK